MSPEIGFYDYVWALSEWNPEEVHLTFRGELSFKWVVFNPDGFVSNMGQVTLN